MCAAGALRGSPASMTMTERHCRPSCKAAARPAAEPPMTATSQWRSMRRDPFSLMSRTICVHPGTASSLLPYWHCCFRSEVVKVAGQADVTTTMREYDPFKLISAALIVGTGGASFITAMRIVF